MARTREEYNTCMRPYITGKGIPKEERRQNFCIGAKICTGKAKDEKEALRLCQADWANPEKQNKTGKSRKTPYDQLEPIPVTIDGKQVLLPPSEFARICACSVSGKPSKTVMKADTVRSSMTDEQIEALSIMAVVKNEYGTPEKVH